MSLNLAHFDDLQVVSGNLDRPHSFTLTGLIHDEMYFLPAFLPHYRALGVDRFVFLDDRSTDGSTAFLAEQPDVVVVHSQHRFGDRIDPEQAKAAGWQHNRMDLIWRTLMVEKFCTDQWSLHLDADEFLDLPAGMDIKAVAARAEAEGAEAVWSVMIDMYPARFSDLQKMQADTVIDLDGAWYFDGRPHLKLRRNAPPRKAYTGSRARLLSQRGLNRRADWFSQTIGRHIGLGPPNYNAIRKPALLRWRAGAAFHTSHSLSLNGSTRLLLPLRHFKFNGAVSRRIEAAIADGMYPNGASEYADLARLLGAMAANDAPFIGPRSVRFTGFDDFRRAGVTIGL